MSLWSHIRRRESVAWPSVRALAAVALAVALAALASGIATWRQGIASLDAALDDKLSISGHVLASELERMRHLPLVLGEDPRLRAALLAPGTPARIAAANDYLQRARGLTGADEAYLIGTDGITIAASNWDEPGSFLGMHYGFRPYFLRAMTDGTAHYYAIGVTTGRPGAFLSARVGPDVAPLGVAVIKMELDEMELAWTRAGELTAVADGDGMVFLAAPPQWRFRPIRPLGAESLSRIATEQRYAGMDIAAARPLPIRDNMLTQAGLGDLRIRAAAVPGTDWQVLVALPVGPARQQALLIALVTATAGFLISAFAMNLLQRRQILRLRLREADRLEARVEERTRALALEVEVRTRAEAELRRTHESLVHAAKLAVLGRMSSAIVHEVGQSLSALDNNLAAAELHAAQNRPERLAPALERARSMLRRLQGVVARLRGFGSRQVPVDLTPVRVDQPLQLAAELVTPRARELGVTLSLPAAGTARVTGDAPRLEQVLTNLLLNAVEATARSAAPRHVAVTLQPAGADLEIRIRDSGPGIPPELQQSVLEPFFTTRTGEGLGLGLYIVQSLLEQMQGELRFAPAPGGGTLAVIRLPAALEPVA